MEKLSLISVHDYHHKAYSAHYEICVEHAAGGKFSWLVRIYSNQPIGWQWDGKLHEAHPPVAKAAYPSDAHLLRQDQYDRLSPEEQAKERQRQDEWRAACAKAHQEAPQPVYLLTTKSGVADNEEAAREQSQKWVMKEMEKYRIKSGVRGYAIPLPVDFLDGAPFKRFVRKARDLILMALAYSTTVRNNRLTQVLNAVDGGAGNGLWRIYDGTRPASGGTATTKLAELTLSKPSSTVSGGVLTYASITNATALATSTATWSRVTDSTGTFVIDGNVGTSGSDLNLNSTSINTGVTVSITSATITEGNA